MTKGEGSLTKVHYKGKDEDFVIFVDNAKMVQDWRADKSIPLAQVVDSFKIFITHKHGAQGTFDGASKATLENEFGTQHEEDAIKVILEKGNLQETEASGRQGDKNDSMGPRSAH